MCAAWKKKNERNEIVCFYCTQSDILLCGIARFSRGNKNKLRTFQPQKWKKIKSSQPQTKFTGSYKKKECTSLFSYQWLIALFTGLLLSITLYYYYVTCKLFSCEVCEISTNTFSCRAPLVAASGVNLHFIVL